jgi:hypothetical protein
MSCCPPRLCPGTPARCLALGSRASERGTRQGGRRATRPWRVSDTPPASCRAHPTACRAPQGMLWRRSLPTWGPGARALAYRARPVAPNTAGVCVIPFAACHRFSASSVAVLKYPLGSSPGRYPRTRVPGAEEGRQQGAWVCRRGVSQLWTRGAPTRRSCRGVRRRTLPRDTHRVAQILLQTVDVAAVRAAGEVARKGTPLPCWLRHGGHCASAKRTCPKLPPDT